MVFAGAKAYLVAAMASPAPLQGALTSGKLKLEKGGPADLAAVLDLFRD